MRSAVIHLALAATAAVVAACAGGGDSAAVDGGDLSGEIRIDGSSTVFLIAEAVAEEFQIQHPAVRITVGVSGSGGGFNQLCRGEIDIANASQPMDEAQLAECRRNGVEPVPVDIGWDGISLVVNPQNRFVQCLTLEELRRIWDEDAEVQLWSDVRDGWPREEMELYGPGSDSGTFDYFTEKLFGTPGISRADFQPSEDDNVLVRGIAGEPYGFGYFGYAYFSENQDRLRLVALDEGNGCVAPSEATIESGEYGLSRRLYLYVNRASLEKAQVRGYVRFMLGNAAELVASTGYHALEQAEYDSILRTVLAEVDGDGE